MGASNTPRVRRLLAYLKHKIWLYLWFSPAESLKKGASALNNGIDKAQKWSADVDANRAQPRNRAGNAFEGRDGDYPNAYNATAASLQGKQNLKDVAISTQHGGQALSQGAAAAGFFLDAATRAKIAKDALELAAQGGKSLLEREAAAQFAVKEAENAARLTRKDLPALTGSFADAFEGGARVRTYKAGERVYRSPGLTEPTDEPGSWFGTRKTATRAGTESQSNVDKWGNPLRTLRSYEFTKDVSVYYGKVAGGTGHHILVPKDVSPGSVLTFIEETPLK